VELVWQAAGYDGVEATVEYLPKDHGFLLRLLSRQEREESQPLATSGAALKPLAAGLWLVGSTSKNARKPKLFPRASPRKGCRDHMRNAAHSPLGPFPPS
jgi:hypothetical protein